MFGSPNGGQVAHTVHLPMQGDQGNATSARDQTRDETVSKVIGGAKLAIAALKTVGEGTGIGAIKAVADVCLEIVNTVEVRTRYYFGVRGRWLQY